MSLAFLDASTGGGNMTLAVAYAFLGMICIILAFGPGFYNTGKTKDTKFLPIKLFSLFLLTGVLMTAGSICGICEAPSLSSFYIRGGIFVLLNVFVTSTNLYTVGLGCVNRLRDRSRGSSEVEEEQDLAEFQEDPSALNMEVAI